jgi:hypothetical protein
LLPAERQCGADLSRLTGEEDFDPGGAGAQPRHDLQVHGDVALVIFTDARGVPAAAAVADPDRRCEVAFGRSVVEVVCRAAGVDVQDGAVCGAGQAEDREHGPAELGERGRGDGAAVAPGCGLGRGVLVLA